MVRVWAQEAQGRLRPIGWAELDLAEVSWVELDLPFAVVAQWVPSEAQAPEGQLHEERVQLHEEPVLVQGRLAQLLWL